MADEFHNAANKLRGARGRHAPAVGAGVGANTLHHRTEPVRPLRRQVLPQAKAIEKRDGVGRENLVGVLAGIHCEQDGNEPPHDMSVTVAGKVRTGPP